MKEKDVILFNKAIHGIKKIMVDIEKERKGYHRKLEKLLKTIDENRDGHDKEMKLLFVEGKELLDELYELFEDLSNGEGK